MKSYKELNVWTVSMDFVVSIYKLTFSFPQDEQYGLSLQMRRCSVSIPSNIAEGSGRNNTKEYIQFLYIANGSLSEIETQLEISHRLKYIEDISPYSAEIKRIRKMLINLIAALQKKVVG